MLLQIVPHCHSYGNELIGETRIPVCQQKAPSGGSTQTQTQTHKHNKVLCVCVCVCVCVSVCVCVCVCAHNLSFHHIRVMDKDVYQWWQKYSNQEPTILHYKWKFLIQNPTKVKVQKYYQQILRRKILDNSD